MRKDGKKVVLMISHQYTGVTGFANVTRRVASALDAAGHEVYVIGQNYKGMPITPKETGNVVMLPSGADQWGADIVPFYMDVYKPDILWTLTDIWACHYIHQLPRKWPWHWVRHVTIDTENITPWWSDTIRQTDVPIAFSKVVKRMLESIGVDWGTYIPHGVDVSAYKPIADEAERAALRSELEVMEVFQQANLSQVKGKVIRPDDFVVLCVAHNQFRKNLDVLLRAFARFAIGKEDVKLVLHTQPRDGLGWDLPQLVRKYQLSGKVLFTSMNAKMLSDVFVSERMMRNLYAISDVHALLTGGEGFGIPFVEAMACGIPNIGTMWTTPREFLADESETEIERDGKKVLEHKVDMRRGLLVPIDHVVDHHTGGEWGIANEAAATDAIQFLYQHPDARAAMGKAAREFAVENYDWAKILPRWVEVIEDTERFALVSKPDPPTLKLLDFRA